MRFSNNGYYIEKYIKCDNCGMLVYGDGINGVRHDKPALFCSEWCVEWSALKATGRSDIRLPIVQPKLPVGNGPTAGASSLGTRRHGDDEHPQFDDGFDLPRDGHPADEDVLFDDLQRGTGFHLCAGGCQG